MRRGSLALCALAAAVALGHAGSAHGEEAVALPPAPAAKKLQHLASKQAEDPAVAAARRAAHGKALARRLGKPPEPVVNLVNTWTNEVLVLPASGQVSIGKDAIDRFFRCHFTNQPTSMDARLFEVLVKATRQFGARKVEIVSGFRAPKYNLMLRKKGREVARDSQHTRGNAVDFRLPGVPSKKLRAWAIKLRLGGVGFYPGSGFVHVDVGPIRQWGGE
jgi:uncharacterized protein YcbK (DUF882 family)